MDTVFTPPSAAFLSLGSATVGKVGGDLAQHCSPGSAWQPLRGLVDPFPHRGIWPGRLVEAA